MKLTPEQRGDFRKTIRTLRQEERDLQARIAAMKDQTVGQGRTIQTVRRQHQIPPEDVEAFRTAWIQKARLAKEKMERLEREAAEKQKARKKLVQIRMAMRRARLLK